MKMASHWLYYVAEQARIREANFGVVAMLGGESLRGENIPSLLDQLNHRDCANTSVLYTFCEPCDLVRRTAERLGVEAMYYVLHRADIQRLISEHGASSKLLDVDVEDGISAFMGTFDNRIRREILQNWGLKLNHGPSRENPKSQTHWLRRVVKKARVLRSNYIYLVRDGKLVGEGRDVSELLLQDHVPSTYKDAMLCTFRELTPLELGRVLDIGVRRIYAAIRKADAKLLKIWPDTDGFDVKIVNRVRNELLPTLTEGWDV
ncbi:MAG: hypothetical protein ABFC88_13015 [Thermoguttaceae bacterium]